MPKKIESKVYFMGAGPGDPQYLTLKALKILKRAELILYPGSLLSSSMLSFLQKKGQKAIHVDTFGKNLEELIHLMVEKVKENKVVARLVSGDPAIYSSVAEQIEELRKRNIPYEIVPGVSSAFYASSRLGIEFTYPNLSHSVVFTRLQGKTGGATPQEIKTFAKTKATLVFFLTAGLISELCQTLLEVLPKETKVALVYKGSHPEERIFLTTLGEAEALAKRENLNRTTLFIVGDTLRLAEENLGERSYLYGKK